jgi:hypothetical protein
MQDKVHFHASYIACTQIYDIHLVCHGRNFRTFVQLVSCIGVKGTIIMLTLEHQTVSRCSSVYVLGGTIWIREHIPGIRYASRRL